MSEEPKYIDNFSNYDKLKRGIDMAEGRKIQLTKQIGEYLVCAELGRRGFISTTFTGNVPKKIIGCLNDELNIDFM